MVSKDRERLIKFGMEQEYLDWKTNLPVTLDKIHIGSKFIVTEGSLKGREGKVIKSQANHTEYVTDIKIEHTNEIVITEGCLHMIKLI